MISFEEFKKVDIRVGTIMAVEIVPDADKLLKLTIDLGEETHRIIVSGIREFVGEPESLVGVQTTFVVNLEPRVIRGIESNGMLFAISGDTFSLLKPEQMIKPGTPLI